MDLGYWGRPTPEIEKEILDTDVDNSTIRAVKHFVQNNVTAAHERYKRDYTIYSERAQEAKKAYDEHKRIFNL